MQLSDNNYQITLLYGYLEQPNIPKEIENLDLGKFKISIENLSFIIGKESLYATDFPGMALWREKIFSLVSRNEISASDYFQLPKDRVVEIGVQIAL